MYKRQDLALYVKATKELAEERKLLFVDLFTGARGGLMDNGMHVTPEAQVKVARAIAGQLGVKIPAAAALNLYAGPLSKNTGSGTTTGARPIGSFSTEMTPVASLPAGARTIYPSARSGRSCCR